MLALPVEGAEIQTLKLFDDAFLLAVPAGEPPSERGKVSMDAVDPRRLILLEEGHCLRDQALAFCALKGRDEPAGLGATSLTTVMQMVANGFGVTLLPEVAAQAEARDGRVKLVRFVAPEPSRTVGLAWRRTSPRRKDFEALAKIVKSLVAATPARDHKRRHMAHA
jgi:LysR family hydrogen peroxide-inducible transcriptional activator